MGPFALQSKSSVAALTIYPVYTFIFVMIKNKINSDKQIKIIYVCIHWKDI